MLLRAGFIYVLSVGVVMLGASVAWQRLILISMGTEIASAADTAANLRTQIEGVRKELGDAERRLRLSQEAIEEGSLHRVEVEHNSLDARSELERLRATISTSNEERRRAEASAVQLQKELEVRTVEIARLRADLDAAKAQSETAKAELLAVQRQMPIAVTGSTEREKTAAEPPVVADVPAPAESERQTKADIANAPEETPPPQDNAPAITTDVENPAAAAASPPAEPSKDKAKDKAEKDKSGKKSASRRRSRPIQPAQDTSSFGSLF